MRHTAPQYVSPPASAAHDVLARRALKVHDHGFDTLSGEFLGRSFCVALSSFNGAQPSYVLKEEGPGLVCSAKTCEHSSFARSLSSGASYCCDRVLEAPDRAHELRLRAIGEPLDP
ncbi:hypothetical protein VTO73DRAFT_15116 [Trametes versicolor]